MSENPVCPGCQKELDLPASLDAMPEEIQCSACKCRLVKDKQKKGFILAGGESPRPLFDMTAEQDFNPEHTPIFGSTLETDGADITPIHTLVGRTIGGCEILKPIGKGGMGAVYKARQISLDRPVAFKVIGEGIQRDESFLRRFDREAKTIAKFQSNRIVQVHEVGFEQGIHFIVMEFVSGGDLKKRTKSLGRVPPEEALRYIRQASEGLLAAERQNIIHRDLKPENLMLDADGNVKITDFGLAKAFRVDYTLTRTGNYMGTPIYMSPEQAQGLTLDHRSDVYSLGASLFYLITGDLPYTGDTLYEILRKKNEFEYLDPRDKLEKDSVPPGICAIVRRMTARQPKDRYDSFADLIEDIDRLDRGQKLKNRREGSRWPTRLGVAALLLLLPGLSLGYAFREELKERVGGYLGLGTTGESQVYENPGQPGVSPGEAGSTESTPEKSSTVPVVVVAPGVVKPEVPSPRPPPSVPKTSSSRVETIPPPPPPMADEEILERIGGFQARLAECSDVELVAHDSSEFRDEIPREGHPDHQDALVAIIRDAEHYSRIQELLLEYPAIPVEAPFGELVTSWEDLRGKILSSSGTTGPEISRCLAMEVEKRGGELVERAAARSGEYLKNAVSQSHQFRMRKVSVEEFLPLVENLEESRKNLEKAFPAAAETWETAIPGDKVEELRSAIAAREQLDMKAESLLLLLGKAESAFGTLGGTRDWSGSAGDSLRATLKGLDEELVALREADQYLLLDQHTEKLGHLTGLKEQWIQCSARFERALASFHAHRLSSSALALEEVQEGGLRDQDAPLLVAAGDAMTAGFGALLEKLDLEDARKRFSEARESLQKLSSATAYPDQCLRRLAELETLVAPPDMMTMMTPVLPGEVKVRSSAPRHVEGFFLDPCEVSIKDYLHFVQELKGKSFEEVRDIFATEDSFRRARNEPGYLVNLQNRNDLWPVESVSYYEAAAYLKTNRKDLFTLEEWWLASQVRLPHDPSDVNTSGYLKVVNEGGQALLHPEVHHLSGNAAEWTRRKDEAEKTEVVGGSYKNRSEKLFTGEIPESLDLGDTRRGYGFRGVVRPAEFFAGLVPEEQAGLK